QELPKPISKVTWDNAAYVSPGTAVSMGFSPEGEPERASEQVVTLTYRNRHLDLPLFVLPGHPDGSVTVHLGYGRTRGGRVGTGAGGNANAIRTADAGGFVSGVTLRSAGRRQLLARTQHHHRMEGREIIREGTLRDRPHIPPAAHDPRRSLSLYADPPDADRRGRPPSDAGGTAGHPRPPGTSPWGTASAPTPHAPRSACHLPPPSAHTTPTRRP